jgi:hypothetical protein
MVQGVSHQPLTTEAHVKTQTSPCWIYSGLRETGTGYSEYSSSSLEHFITHSFISDAR